MCPFENICVFVSTNMKSLCMETERSPPITSMMVIPILSWTAVRECLTIMLV